MPVRGILPNMVHYLFFYVTSISSDYYIRPIISQYKIQVIKNLVGLR